MWFKFKSDHITGSVSISRPGFLLDAVLEVKFIERICENGCSLNSVYANIRWLYDKYPCLATDWRHWRKMCYHHSTPWRVQSVTNLRIWLLHHATKCVSMSIDFTTFFFVFIAALFCSSLCGYFQKSSASEIFMLASVYTMFTFLFCHKYTGNQH